MPPLAVSKISQFSIRILRAPSKTKAFAEVWAASHPEIVMFYAPFPLTASPRV